MSRILAAAFASLSMVTACAPREAELSAAEPPSTTAAAPVPQPAADPTPAASGTRVGTMNLMCGGETFRIAFEDARAVLVNTDGSNSELARLPADANSAPGVDTFTDGKMTFTRQGGQDSPVLIKFARGRMALQNCAIAQN